jgi:hypothetical protein
VNLQVRSELGVKAFCSLLADPSVPTDLMDHMYFDVLWRLPPHEKSHAVSALIKYYEDDTICDRLAAYYYRRNSLGMPPQRDEARFNFRMRILDDLG